MPGAGGTSASFISYIFERRINKHGDKFGTGIIEGCAAPESANNAAAAGAFAPLLTLGIPGSSTTALLLGGLMMWGLQPGPLLFTDKPDFVWSLIASFYLGNIVCLIVCFASIPLVMRAVSVSNAILAPIIFAICVVAAYTTNNSMFDVFFMIGAGVFSYFLRLSKVPAAPLLLAFVLSPMFEKYTRQSFDMTRGDPSIFIRNSICWTFIALILIFCVSPLIVKRIKAAKKTS
jgi:putative tricarboxylic transport membrane protein